LHLAVDAAALDHCFIDTVFFSGRSLTLEPLTRSSYRFRPGFCNFFFFVFRFFFGAFAATIS
jgi:hypothetical protein